MSESRTISVTDTYTEARARYVMGKVYDDLINLMNAELITKEYADSTRNEILYLLSKKAMLFFEFQFTLNDIKIGGIRYEVKSDSSISMDDDSGNIDFWDLDKDVTVLLCIRKDSKCPCLAEVNAQLSAWGWGSGSILSGSPEYSKSYSKDGFGVKQYKLGKW